MEPKTWVSPTTDLNSLHFFREELAEIFDDINRMYIHTILEGETDGYLFIANVTDEDIEIMESTWKLGHPDSLE